MNTEVEQDQSPIKPPSDDGDDSEELEDSKNAIVKKLASIEKQIGDRSLSRYQRRLL